jgi:hypothetical protein
MFLPHSTYISQDLSYLNLDGTEDRHIYFQEIFSTHESQSEIINAERERQTKNISI